MSRPRERESKFLKELTKLSKKHNIGIGGMPFSFDLKEKESWDPRTFVGYRSTSDDSSTFVCEWGENEEDEKKSAAGAHGRSPSRARKKIKK